SRLDNPYRSRQVEALTTALARKGFRPLLFCIEPGEPVEATLRLLLDYQVSGVVITSGAPDDRIVRESAGKGVPLILVDRPDTAAGPVDHVRGDNAAGGRLVAEALRTSGRRKVIAFRPKQATHSLRVRIESLCRACADLGLGFAMAPMAGYDYEAGFLTVSRFLQGDAAVPLAGKGALFLPNDVSALGGLDAVRQAGLRVPGDLALMGYDDIAQASWVGIQLSTVRQDASAVAQAVVSLLERRIAAPGCAPRCIEVPVALRLRTTH
ncbi:MAG: substrate-binding domain-containing protein, partial [Pseudomonadota bacterium]